MATFFIRSIPTISAAIALSPHIQTLSIPAAELTESTPAVSAAATAMTFFFLRGIRAVTVTIAALRPVDAGAVFTLKVHPVVAWRAVDFIGAVDAVAVAVAEAATVDTLAVRAGEVDVFIASVGAAFFVGPVQAVWKTVAAKFSFDALAVDALEVERGWATALALHCALRVEQMRINQILLFVDGCAVGSRGCCKSLCRRRRCCCRCCCCCCCC